MGKYAQIKRFHNYHWLQVFMYDFIYIYFETIPESA